MSPLLTIDEDKVKEAIKHAPQQKYNVRAHMITAKLELQEAGEPVVGGTIALSALPPNNAEARKVLLSLRTAIEKSGTKLKTEAALDHEIDEMRRRTP